MIQFIKKKYQRLLRGLAKRLIKPSVWCLVQKELIDNFCDKVFLPQSFHIV